MGRNIDTDDFMEEIVKIQDLGTLDIKTIGEAIDRTPTAPLPWNVIEIPKTGIGDLSDGIHTFNGLYKQRMILFAALVKAYRDKAWKSYRHEDGEYCFGGGWFIVGIDTPEGSYTYHYKNEYWDMFDCIELPRAKHWDGHTETDAETRLMSLKPERAKGEWIDVPCGMNNTHKQCTNCNATFSQHDYYSLCEIMNGLSCELETCPMCGADMRGNENAESRRRNDEMFDRLRIWLR